ncbi:hypothetical protein FPQ18DRAFT_410387 [Pyronema domesticum]|nr:hypothetical protein FPQ18DRAFT_410387 [Pyronema domesticum]
MLKIVKDDVLPRIKQWISPLEPHKRRYDILAKRLKGTGAWFLKSREFQSWYNTNNDSDNEIISQDFTCYGMAGAGKSVMSARDTRNATRHNFKKYLLENAGAQQNLGICIGQPNLEEVCNLLRKALHGFDKAFICIDALDECVDEYRQSFLTTLEDILGDSTLKQSARLFLTGRLHVEDSVRINMSKLGAPISVILGANSEEIRTYISRQLDLDEYKEDCINEDLRKEIVEKIVENSGGMFILPALQIQTVLEETTLSRRLTITRIKEQLIFRARQAMEDLKWVLLSMRQLKVRELCHALAVTPGKHLDGDNFLSEKSLTAWCLGLAILDKETCSIRLVHKSLFEYLKKQHESG